MAGDCSTCFAKYILCLFNFAVFVAGICVLGVGIWLSLDRHSFLALAKISQHHDLPQFEQFTQPTVIAQLSYILMAAGAFVFVLSFLGYCGALRESRCLLTLYGILLLVILLLEITAAGMALVYKGKAEEETRKFLKSTIKDYYTPVHDKTDAVTAMWNSLMAQMSCCGVDSYQDFQASKKFAQGNMTIPVTCCFLVGDFKKFTPKDPECPYKPPSAANSYHLIGCYKTVAHWFMKHMDVVVWVVMGVLLVELLGIFFSFCLCKSFQPYYDK